MVDLRRNLTSQWEEFVAEWCLGIEPAQPPVEVERALDALRRLWPESLDDLQAHGARGLTFVAGAIENGLTLATCKSLSGFGPVMKRLRGGEESALAELQFARALVRCGFRPVLEPDIGSKVLDCSIGIGSERVFAEVIAPEQAAGIKSAQDTIRRLATGVVERSRGTRTEVLLTVEPEARFDSILDAAVDTPPDGSVRSIEGVGWVRRDLLGPQPPNVGSLIYNPDPSPTVVAASMRKDEEDIFTSVTVRLPMTDERAHRLLGNELSHFSSDERNILAIRVSNVPGGMKWWQPLILRWLQPTRNRRVGAVILFEQAQVVGQHPSVTNQR